MADDNDLESLKVLQAANCALIESLIKRVSAYNLEIYKEIMDGAIAAVHLEPNGPIDKKIAAKAHTLLVEKRDADIKRMTPQSALGPGGFQSKVF